MSTTTTTTPVTGIVVTTETATSMTEPEKQNKQGMTTSTAWNTYNLYNVLAYIVNVFVTFAIGSFGLFGQPNNSELSDKYQTIVTPFGTSFSIWGLIFIWQAFWVVWQLLPTQRNSEGVIRAWYYYPLMTIFQAGWTISFSYEAMWIAAVCMYAILLTLILASMSLQKYTNKTWKGYLLWQGPLSVQTGWIMAASGVMTNVLTVSQTNSTTTLLVVAAGTLAVLTVTALSWLASYPVDFAIPLVLIWALGGVYAELSDPAVSITDQFSTTQITGTRYGVLAGLCLISTCVILKLVYIFAKQRPRAIQQQQEQEQKYQLDDDEKV